MKSEFLFIFSLQNSILSACLLTDCTSESLPRQFVSQEAGFRKRFIFDLSVYSTLTYSAHCRSELRTTSLHLTASPRPLPILTDERSYLQEVLMFKLNSVQAIFSSFALYVDRTHQVTCLSMFIKARVVFFFNKIYVGVLLFFYVGVLYCESNAFLVETKNNS